MSILKKIFAKKDKNEGKKEEIIHVYAPFHGKIIDLSKIPDQAFAEKLIGDGVGIEPSENGNTIFAPVNTNDLGIFETNHAVSFDTKEGLELIVHFGIDTVKLNGEGFERIAAEGSAVKTGDALIKFNLAYIKDNAKSHLTPVVISNMDDVEHIEKMTGEVKPGDLLMKVVLKNN